MEGTRRTTLTLAMLLLCTMCSCSAPKNHTPTLQPAPEVEQRGPFEPPTGPAASVYPDVVLLRVCMKEITQFCRKFGSVYDYLPCLVDAVADPSKQSAVTDACRKETEVQRWLMSPDFRLGPHAHPACTSDVREHCNFLTKGVNGEPTKETDPSYYRKSLQVASCLKQRMALNKFEGDCAAYMMLYIREGALDYTKDRSFTFECQTEIRRHCIRSLPRTADEVRSGQLSECLKLKFLAHFISDLRCRDEVIASLQASRHEVRTDPLVYAPCYDDLTRHCADVPPGHGRRMSCLLKRLDSGERMQLQCMHMLRRRMAMWKFGAMISPSSFPEYAAHRHYGGRVTHFLFVYMNYLVAGGALLLALCFSLAMVAVLNKRRRLRQRKEIAYVRIEQSKAQM